MALWQEKFISPNQYSRPQKKLIEVRKVVIHWTANLGATAEGHQRYFNNLDGRYASAHFFTDSKESLLIIPLDELAYHANDGTTKKIAELKPNANQYSIGIEMCVEKDGSFHPNTINQTVAIAAELCKRFQLDPQTDIVRHFDITGKSCPAPWVSDSAQFVSFKHKVATTLKGGTASATVVKAEPTQNPVLKEGDNGTAVKRLQTDLNLVGGYKLTADGAFGAGTKKALVDYQSKKRLTADGIAGQATWSAIAKDKDALEKAEEEAAKSGIGTVEILKNIPVRDEASAYGRQLKVLAEGGTYKVYALKDDFYNVGGNQWIYSKGGYTRFTPAK